MQSSLCAVSNSSANYLCWPFHRDGIPITRTAKNLNSKSPLKPLIISNSLKTSFYSHNDFHSREGNFKNSEEEEEGGGRRGSQFGVSYRLPIVVRNSSAVLRYFWDGNKLKLVALDGNSFSLWDFCTDFDDGFRKLVRICASALRNFLLPREFSPNYLEYVKWKFLHRVSSSALQVLATQAMFRAIGIGFSRSLPSAAALNWVLKDGLGRLTRCIYTASLASAFDTNLKRVRFSTSVLFSLSIGVELLTPVFPQYFLLLASIANIAKQISLACYLATGTAVHRSFAVADNLGEVSAKAQIQTVCFDNLGLVLAAMMNIAIKNNQRLQAALPFLVYPIFTTLDLLGIYQGLKHVHLQTLTKDRLEIIINMWIQEHCIPSPAEVSRKESINFWGTEGRKELPIRIGCLNPRNQLPKLSVLTIQALNNEDFFFICMESFNNISKDFGQQHGGIVLCLREGAQSSDIILGLIQACHVREALLRSRSSMWGTILDDYYTNSNEEWFKLTENGKQFAEANLRLLHEEMSKLGWACKNILLSSQEQARYSFVAD